MSTVAAVSNPSYTMWTRIPREDGNAPKIGDEFKLTEKHVPQDAAQPAALPMAHIWQGAVQFDQNLRDRQQAEALNKQVQQQTLANSTELTAAQVQKSNGAAPWMEETKTSGLTPAKSKARYTPSSGQAKAAPVSYSAQGYQAKPVSANATRIGSVLDFLA